MAPLTAERNSWLRPLASAIVPERDDCNERCSVVSAVSSATLMPEPPSRLSLGFMASSDRRCLVVVLRESSWWLSTRCPGGVRDGARLCPARCDGRRSVRGGMEPRTAEASRGLGGARDRGQGNFRREAFLSLSDRSPSGVVPSCGARRHGAAL